LSFRCLETDDDYFDHYIAPVQSRWKITGLNFHDELLRKIYDEKAERIFSEFKGAP